MASITKAPSDATFREIQVGIVKDNTDVQRMGRIRVYLPALEGDPNDEQHWVTVSYCSPFAGATNILHTEPSSEKFEDTQKAYGMWFPVPELENEVIVLFVNGDQTKGIYIGGMYQQFMNYAVPGIPGAGVFEKDTDTDALKKIKGFLPSAEYNKNKISQYKTPRRPRNEPLTNGLIEQGLTQDYIRGVNTSGAQRTNVSRTYGILTPRGHQIVFDDGYTEDELGDVPFRYLGSKDNIPGHGYVEKPKVNERKDEYIRFRTRSGAQIMINEEHGMIYMISRDGNNWVEMANDGHIDVYAKDDVSVHTEQSINLHAEKDINIEAGRNINMKANGQHVEDETHGTGNIYIESGPSTPGNDEQTELGGVGNKSNIHMTSHGSTYQHAAENHHIVVEGSAFTMVTGSFSELVGGSIAKQAGGNIDLSSAGNFNEQAGANFSIVAGGVYAEDASQIHMNGGVASPAAAAAPGTDATTPKVYNLVKGDADDVSTENKDVIEGIVDRAPEQEPWKGHRTKEQEVPRAKTDPSPSVEEQVDENGNSVPSTPVDKLKTQDAANAASTPLSDQRKPTSDPRNKVTGATSPELTQVSLVEASNRIKSKDQADTPKEPVADLTMSEKGALTLINREQYYPTQYWDGGKYTIGYGHQITGEESPEWKAKIERGLTEDEAYELFLLDSHKHQAGVRRDFAGQNLSQNEFDALVNMRYNTGSFGTSMTANVKGGNADDVADTMLLYNKSAGKTLPGLINRRESEANMYRNGEYPKVKTRAEHKADAVRRLEKQWASQNIEPARGRPTTLVQVKQAQGAYERLTGNDITQI